MEEYPFDLLYPMQEQTAINCDGEKKECTRGAKIKSRKRKREQVNPKIINLKKKQMFLFHNALLDEPKLSENSNLLRSWAEFLSCMGPTVTVSKLGRWINNLNPKMKGSAPETSARACSKIEPGDFVCLLNERWDKMGSGRVVQTRGKWHGIVNGTLNIEDAGLCIVKLKEHSFTILPYPSKSGGSTVPQAPHKSIIAWDADKIVASSVFY